MNEEIKYRVVVDDADVNRFVNNTVQGGEQAKAAIDGVGTATQRTVDKMVSGLKETEAEIIANTRAANNYKAAIKDNEDQIDALNKQIRQETILLKQLQKEYKQLGTKSTKDAATLKGQIDALNLSIQTAAADTEVLSLRNKELQDDLAKTGKGFALNKQQAANLTFQLNDLFVQLASGQGVIRPLIQQGPQITQIFGGFRNTMQAVGQAVKGATARILTMRGALMLGAGAIVALIAIPLIAFFTKSQEAADWLGNKMAYLKGVVQELGARFLNFGEALFGLIRGTKSLNDVWESTKDIFTGTGTSLGEAGRAAQALRIELKALAAEQKQIAENQLEVNARMSQFRQLADDDRRSISDRIKAERQYAVERRRSQVQELQHLRRARRAAIQNGETEEELFERKKAIAELEQQIISDEFASERRLYDLRQTGIEQAKERREALADLAKEAQKLRDRLFELENADATGLDKIRFDAIKAGKEIDVLEESLRSLYAERGRAFDLEEEFARMREINAERTTRKIEDFENQQTIARLRSLEQQRAAEDAALQRQLQTLDRQQELQLLLNEAQRRNNLSEVEAEQAKELEKLEITRRYAEARLDIIEQQFGPASQEAALLRAQIELYRQQYERLANTDLSPLERLRGRIQDALGLTPEQLQQVGQLFGQIGATFTDAIVGITDAQIEQQQRRIDLLRDQVSETESALQEELRLQEQGYANDADLLKQNLTTRQQLLAEAEAKQLALEKKAARQRLAIDAAQQASDYVSTVTGLLAGQAKFGLPGLLAVIGGIALVAKIIAQARATAKQFEAPRFREGTPYVDGPGDGRSDSINAWLSRGERVVDASSNAAIGGRSLTTSELVHYVKLGKLAEARPDFAGIDQAAAAVVVQGREVSEGERQLQRRMMYESYRQASREATAEMIAYWKSRPVIMPDGSAVRYEGNTKVIERYKKM